MEWTSPKRVRVARVVVVVVANVVNDYSNDSISKTLPNPEKLS